ncbi:MAG: hypothetical protein IJP44_07040 [Bacteroidales bacterium]|nr:hypothetical protein [Bacteroidales bacterium]
MMRFAVYTVITGGFDELKQPLAVDDRFDYVVFSDREIQDSGVWEVRLINQPINQSMLSLPANNRQKSRLPKIRPDIFLPDYEATLYIDGNICICSSRVYDRCSELYEAGIEWAGIKHQGRQCLYDELNAIIGLGWVHDYDVLDWYGFLHKEGFPEQDFMFENNIIFRLNTSYVKAVDELWWRSIQEQRVKRDQFSLMYALWKRPETKTTFLLNADENAWRNDGAFVCDEHKPNKRILDKTLWEKMRNRYVRMFYWDGGWEIYYTRWFDKLLKWPFPRIAMHLWTAWMAVRHDSGFLLKKAWNKLKRNN